jgi:hypothetical protein
MAIRKRFATFGSALLCLILLLPAAAYAQNPVLGEVKFVGVGKAAKTSGVWVDGQYLGYLDELKGDKKVLLLPGEHDITVRQAGYRDFIVQNVVVEPGKRTVLHVKMRRDPRVRYPEVFSEVKLDVEPSRAAVFLDGAFVGHVGEFKGHWRGMLVSPGEHEIRIALPGYQDFATQFDLLPHQEFTVKTELVKGSITQAGALIVRP